MVRINEGLFDITEIHRANGISTYNTYNARDQIVTLKNICDDCQWVISEYDYTYDNRGFISSEKAVESLYAYAYDDKHNGKHENGRHDDLYPQRPDYDINKAIANKKIDANDMAYGTCVDVTILLNNATYYIPAIVVDTKGNLCFDILKG